MIESKNIRGNRSKIILVPDSKEYYKGLSIIKWYYYEFISKVEYLLMNNK